MSLKVARFPFMMCTNFVVEAAGELPAAKVLAPILQWDSAISRAQIGHFRKVVYQILILLMRDWIDRYTDCTVGDLVQMLQGVQGFAAG